jgi:RNA polymerase sigma factor (TIGR02999 family)
VSKEPSQPVSELLVRWKEGDQDALERLVPLVYKELRDIARLHLLRERPGHTLQSAALVHEAYLRLLDQRPFHTENRAHFLAVASRLMRQILVDYSRSHGAAKRGADRRVELDALNGLTQLDEQQGRIVELRFFGGLATEEIAEVLGISPSTVKRDWNVAKAWLSREMKKKDDGKKGAVAES